MKNKVEFSKAFKNYNDSLLKVKERRQQWKTESKELIFNVLTQITQENKFAWHVQRLESMENYQTINISINTLNSGISETEYNDSGKPIKYKAYPKDGGYLAYCQSFNGKINVVLVYPYIEEIVTQMEPKLIDTVEPNSITEELIYGHLTEFIKEMDLWEGSVRQPIGYQINIKNNKSEE